MLSRSNYMKVFNELDEIYTSKSFEHLSLLTFLNKNVYESPMIYWNINRLCCTNLSLKAYSTI